MLEIKVLGTGCPTCKRLEQMCQEIVSEKGLEARVEKVTDLKKIVEYGVSFTPGLVINGELKSAGKIPSKTTLEHWILEANKQ